MNNSTHPKSKAEATKRAKELCNYLNKNICKGWKYLVSENLGWHFSVTLGSISVHENIHTKKYYAMVSHQKKQTLWSIRNVAH